MHFPITENLAIALHHLCWNVVQLCHNPRGHDS
jgi:hypothetical protein